jgi:hypothetical protein
MKEASKTLLLLLVLAVIWSGAIFLINPIGDFPLNDDWAFAYTVQKFMEDGSLEFSGWISLPLIAHAAWGALFSLLFGFSFTTLRFSVIVLGLAGVLATYGLLSEARAGRQFAFFGALTVMFNPVYFELSNTFMSDVSFFSFSMLSFLFFMRGMRRESALEILAGAMFALVAVLIRQLALMIPLSFGIAYLAKNGLKRKSLITALVPLILVAGGIFAFLQWLEWMGQTPERLNLMSDAVVKHSFMGFKKMIFMASKNTINALTYYGVFLMPFLIMLAPHKWRSLQEDGRLRCLTGTFVFIVIASVALIWQGRIMPLRGNVLYDFGLGPPTLRNEMVLKLRYLPEAPESLWLVLTIAGVFCGALLVASFISAISFACRRHREDGSKEECWYLIMPLAACIVYLVPIALLGFFDRYLLGIVPLLMIVALGMRHSKFEVGRRARALAVTILVVYGIFSVCATHDYLSWNRMRWRALNFLTEQKGVSYSQIDGGFEFNGLHGYSPDYVPCKGKSWWWVKEDKYVISFGPIPGYSVYKVYPYEKWMPPGEGEVMILSKKTM